MSHWQGTHRVMEISTGKDYYTIYDATALYVEKEFGFRATKISLFNESDNVLQFSFDGVTLHGEIQSWQSRDVSREGKTSIFVRVDNATGTNNIHITAY